MDTPTFDSDGYPTDGTLYAIRHWKIEDGLSNLWRFFCEAYNETYGRIWEDENGLQNVATGGWSGNESLIDALNDHWIFWSVCWESSHRGGKYVFDLRRAAKCEVAK